MNTRVKNTLVACSIALISLTTIMTDAQAARLGGKKSSGMQRSSESYSSPSNTNSATGTATAPQRNPQTSATPNAAQKPSTTNKWLGPIAGIAAAIGIGALLSHLGFGEGLASILSFVLYAGLAFLAFKLIMNFMRRKSAPAGNAPNPYSAQMPQSTPAHQRTNGNSISDSPNTNIFGQPIGGTAASTNPSSPTNIIPASHINADEFLRLSKGYFIRLQAANDKKDTDDLRRFLTPEMFAEAQLQIAERPQATQTTDILQLNATVLSLVTEGTHDIGSVRFTGQIKCSDQAMAEDFSEVWHFSKWRNHDDQWSLAGIQQDN